jgi:pimeloyl-ACP methyl ester carboxylesterase
VVRSDQQAVVNVDGHEIAYRRAGQGPALVLLHGFLCDSRVWRTQLSALSGNHTVIAWDAPGAGLSSDPVSSFTIQEWALVLAAFLDTVGIDRAHVLGLSWGGLLAQEYYRLRESRVLTLILADTYAGWKGSLGAPAAAQRLERCIRESSLPPADFVARWVPKEFFTDNAPRAVVEEMSAVVSGLHPAGFRLMAASLALADTTALLPRIAVPTLLLWGEGDRRSPLTVAESFRAAIPSARLEVIPGAGHVSNMERPDAFNERVLQFLALADRSRSHVGGAD